MNDQEQELGGEGSFISHLLELRNRLLYIIVVVLVVFIPLALFSERVYHELAAPVLNVMPTGGGLIVTNPLQAFLTPIKLAFFVAILLTIPHTLYQLWAFIAPGLYRHERKLVFPLLLSSTVLFYAGIAFAYFVVFPLVFGFLTAVTPAGVSFMPDIQQYQDFVFTLFFAFGVAFELPVALVLLTSAGIVDPEKLATKRPYVVLWVFVIAMLLTPPDAFSQTLLAIPMLVLFEIGLFVSRRIYRAKRQTGDETEAQMDRELDAALREGDRKDGLRDTKGNKRR